MLDFYFLRFLFDKIFFLVYLFVCFKIHFHLLRAKKEINYLGTIEIYLEIFKIQEVDEEIQYFICIFQTLSNPFSRVSILSN